MAATTAAAAVPGVQWAQRPKCIFLTMDVSDCKEHDIRLEKDSLHFKGRGGPDAKEFEINMKFLKEIDPEKSKYAVRPRAIEFALGKEYPARLSRFKQCCGSEFISFGFGSTFFSVSDSDPYTYILTHNFVKWCLSLLSYRYVFWNLFDKEKSFSLSSV
jgi:hypothetical protein